MKEKVLSAFVHAALVFVSFAGGTALRNPPSECKAADSACGCATGEVAVRNVGDLPLHVSRVKACCGATATLSAMTVEPNASAILHVDLKPQFAGEISKSVHFFCDDPKNPVAVAVAGVGCGALVTLLDSLCTGQVYVPVLALLSREPEAWPSFALLAVYNLAFIAPLVAAFVLAAKCADAAQMSRWSKRNVVPSKIALGLVFAILGILLLPFPFVHLGGLFK